MILVIVVLALGGWPDWRLWPFAAAIAAFVVVSEWWIWPKANYVIIHPDHLDTSQLMWGSKMRNRRKHRIRYEDVISLSGDELTGRLSISFKPSGGLGRRLGIQELRVNPVLRTPSEVLEVKEAIEMGRERARQADAASATPVRQQETGEREAL